MDEVLQGIRIIKYFAWEQSFIAKVQEVRFACVVSGSVAAAATLAATLTAGSKSI